VRKSTIDEINEFRAAHRTADELTSLQLEVKSLRTELAKAEERLSVLYTGSALLIKDLAEATEIIEMIRKYQFCEITLGKLWNKARKFLEKTKPPRDDEGDEA
jgi:hypothetical protein